MRWAVRGLAVTMGDFQAAVARVQPSVRREGFNPTPNVTFADVGSLEDVRPLALLPVPC